MANETLVSAGEVTVMMVISLVTTFFLVFMLFLLWSIIKRERYRSKLKKVDLKEYAPLGFGKTGLPAIMQNRKDPNKLIFL